MYANHISIPFCGALVCWYAENFTFGGDQARNVECAAACDTLCSQSLLWTALLTRSAGK